MTIRAFSFGGGVQSTAALVLATLPKDDPRHIDFPLFLFAHVGSDSENPDTLRYVEDVAKPFAAAHGIALVEVWKVRRNGERDTIRTWLSRTKRSIGIPMRMANGAPGNRSCTEQFKRVPITKELKRRGATKAEPAIVGLGISMDEWPRMKSDSGDPFIRNEYPLIDLGIHRDDCPGIVARAGLPPVGKSSCVWCPFNPLAAWARMRRDRPDLFALSVALEEEMNERREEMGKDHVFLSSKAIPLQQVVGDHDQLDLFPDASCDIAGYCHV